MGKSALDKCSSRIDLTRRNISEIIEHMSFKNRSKTYSERCSLYTGGISCHPKIKDLNCLICACPNYFSEDNEGGCRADSNKGKWYEYEEHGERKRVWDCSDCHSYHSPMETRLFLEKNMSLLRAISENL
jgi:Zn-finger protein